jgi:hypothetical protein
MGEKFTQMMSAFSPSGQDRADKTEEVLMYSSKQDRMHVTIKL